MSPNNFSLFLIGFVLPVWLKGCTSTVAPSVAPPDSLKHRQTNSRENTTASAQFPTTIQGENTSDGKLSQPRQSINAPWEQREKLGATRSPDSRNYVARGSASWYGLAAHGTQTASGQIHDLYGMTAAHASLPLLTRVLVKNQRINRSVVVTINDRLYDSNVLIKLSYWAARRLGLVKNPIHKVEVRGLHSRFSLDKRSY